MEQEIVNFYNKSRQQYLNAEITDTEWNFICRNILEILMQDNKKNT